MAKKEHAAEVLAQIEKKPALSRVEGPALSKVEGVA
jgi:hypothetical protein